ncbi:hypothetical protein [Mangrovactinospora gilvigrisea]|uniref:hypothetical protein n=1 Tax=Mangrovactinospora gilvigrisea TaxID=1428644 RepID=UPI000B188F95|nr:hypothetical protein [Mangrovactinospora gilvigrisea]
MSGRADDLIVDLAGLLGFTVGAYVDHEGENDPDDHDKAGAAEVPDLPGVPGPFARRVLRIRRSRLRSFTTTLGLPLLHGLANRTPIAFGD